MVTKASKHVEGEALPLITPGEVLLHEFIEPYALSMSALAKLLNVSATAISEIVRGDRAISTTMAIRLSVCFETSAEFWINLQQHCDMERARRDIGKKIAKEVTPVSAMVRAG